MTLQPGDVGNTNNAVLLLACWLEALPCMQRSGDVICRPGRRTTIPYQMVHGETVGDAGTGHKGEAESNGQGRQRMWTCC